MEALDLILTIGLTARLIRLAVYDDAGERIIRQPIYRIARRLHRNGEAWAEDLTACPFCIGFWLALIAAGSWALAGHTIWWTAIALAFTASYVAGHLAGRLDRDRDWSW